MWHDMDESNERAEDARAVADVALPHWAALHAADPGERAPYVAAVAQDPDAAALTIGALADEVIELRRQLDAVRAHVQSALATTRPL